MFICLQRGSAIGKSSFSEYIRLPECLSVTKEISSGTTETAGYNDIGLCNNSPIASYILWYQLIPHT